VSGQASQHEAGPARGRRRQTTRPDVLSPVIEQMLAGATLVDCLARQQRAPEETAYCVESLDQPPLVVTWASFMQQAARAATGLQQLGVGHRGRVMIILPTGADFLNAFWGTLLASATPVPAYPPVGFAQLPTFADKLAGMAEMVGARVAVVPEALRAVLAPGGQGRVGDLTLVTPEEIMAVAGRRDAVTPPPPVADDLGLVQFSSGSTGDPRAICLTHGNLLSNIRAFLARIGMRPGDVCVSWLPLYHDMGLIGSMIGTILSGTRLVLISPLDFLRRPLFWLQVMSRHGATLSVAPQFAFNLCARKVRRAELVGVDLSPLRVLLNGAEPVQAAGVAAFRARFRAAGLHSGVVIPCYGLAEGTLAVTMRRPGQRLRRASLPDAAGAIVCVGPPMNETEVRIRDQQGAWESDGSIGEICLRGPSACAGYLSAGGRQPSVDADGWLSTGDLGFLDRGELFVTGRLKDLVIIGGRNFYPQDLESVAGEVPGLRPGRAVAFGVTDAQLATQALVVVAETLDHATAGAAATALRRRLLERFGVTPQDIVLVPRGSLPLTTSGKLRRVQTRIEYERGAFPDAVYRARSTGA